MISVAGITISSPDIGMGHLVRTTQWLTSLDPRYFKFKIFGQIESIPSWLDNFDYETTKKAVKIIGNTCQTESSGGITEETIIEYAKCGVDFISVGALTHSVINFDLSLKAI